MITKVLVANSSEALLFSTENLRTEELHFVENFMHPDSRKKVSDLVSDKPGFEQTLGHTASAYEGKHNPKDVEAENFALELAKKIHNGGKVSEKDSVLIVAPAPFYNLFSKHWHHHLPILQHLAKDYTKFTVKELTAKIREHLYI